MQRLESQAHLQEAVQADGQQWGEPCNQTVRVQHVCSRVQERRETRVHRHERRHLCMAGNGITHRSPFPHMSCQGPLW